MVSFHRPTFGDQYTLTYHLLSCAFSQCTPCRARQRADLVQIGNATRKFSAYPNITMCIDRLYFRRRFRYGSHLAALVRHNSRRTIVCLTFISGFHSDHLR